MIFNIKKKVLHQTWIEQNPKKPATFEIKGMDIALLSREKTH